MVNTGTVNSNQLRPNAKEKASIDQNEKQKLH